MTGGERNELASSMEFVRDALSRIETKVDTLDDRVHKIEITSAQQMGVAAGTAAAIASNETKHDKRFLSAARVVGIAASVATIVGVAIGLVIQSLH